METNINKTLDELKTIVMALHRSAGQLDELIQQIELDAFKQTDEEHLQMFIKQCFNYRSYAKRCKGYSELDEMEADIWARLLTDARHEES